MRKFEGTMATVKTVTVVYDHEEGSGWTAESPDAPGYLAYAESFEEVRAAAFEGLRLHFGDQPIAIQDPLISFENYGGMVVSGWPVPPATIISEQPQTTAA
jgi:predicted RNase H-like HicB family nuclease